MWRTVCRVLFFVVFLACLFATIWVVYVAGTVESDGLWEDYYDENTGHFVLYDAVYRNFKGELEPIPRWLIPPKWIYLVTPGTLFFLLAWMLTFGISERKSRGKTDRPISRNG